MVVKTRRGKRKENPTEEEAPRVKFVKTASGENLEKTTMEESETRAVEIVESTAKTTDESTAKMTDVSTEKTTDVLTEKMRKDSTEITAEITEPSNVAAEAAPTTLNKGPARPSPPAPPATPAIGTASGDEENEKPASGDEENEGFEEEQEEPDGENEVNKRSEEEQEEEANGEGEEEENENENPPEPQDIDSIIPTRTPQEERLLDNILEDEDDVDESDIDVGSWEKCLDAGYKVGEQSIQLGDVMKLLKRTMKLMTVDKKVDQLDGRLAPLEEFVKEAQGKAAEEEAPAQGKAKKQKRRKK
ncbi:hypothetical protein HID58_040590 [Brassica napus]|uniref:DUF287 domain-containing protein n=1 Tax=Brassica napus TaxID=3708 RepID=A0ABQ8B9C4_BRANA|nr:hypothetical protein HID58_040590 [Brassica napus]